MNSPDYSKMTDEDFDSILESLVSKMSASTILAYGDVSATLREELNNEVLESWERNNPHLAFPQDHPADRAEISGDSNTGWMVETWSGSHRLTAEPFGHLETAKQRLSDIRVTLTSAEDSDSL